MIDLHLSAFAPRWRFLYAVRIDAYDIDIETAKGMDTDIDIETGTEIEKENEKIFLKKKQRQRKPEAAQQPEKLPEKQRTPLLPAPAMAKRKRRPDGRRSRYCGNRISAC